MLRQDRDNAGTEYVAEETQEEFHGGIVRRRGET